jgi:hypothetical protein
MFQLINLKNQQVTNYLPNIFYFEQLFYSKLLGVFDPPPPVAMPLPSHVSQWSANQETLFLQQIYWETLLLPDKLILFPKESKQGNIQGT